MVTPSNGIHHGVPLKVYQSWDAYSSSDLKAMRQGPPALVPWRKSHPEEASDAIRLGSAAHCAILEPDKFEALYAHKPEHMSFATKEGKAWRDDPCRSFMDILTHKEWEQVGAIVNAFKSKRLALEALDRSGARREVSVLWNDPDTGLRLKARPDLYDDEFVTDLKVTRHATSKVAAFRSWADGWMHQVVHYRCGLAENGIHLKGCRLILVHPEPPQLCRVVCIELKENAASLLQLENEATVSAMAECHESGNWPGEVDEWQKVELPAVALQQNAAMVWEEEQSDVLGR